MHAWMKAVLAVMFTVLPLIAVAQNAPPHTIACDGPFTKDTDEAKLIALFGRGNVAFQEIPGAEGETSNGTVLFPKDPASRLEIFWRDEAARRQPASISISDQSQWTGPKGIRVGMPLVEVEKLNSKPFELSGFDWDYGGMVTDWHRGALNNLGGCTIVLTFRHADDIPSSALRPVLGDNVKLVSSAANVRAVKPIVANISVDFPE
jgi:hypothetical protein